MNFVKKESFIRKGNITLLLIVLSLFVNAQVMPSPDASLLVGGINTPVNLYNGVASISIPLYEVSANNGAKLPVRLSYNTGGIKVNEIASVAGLGWQLSAGGIISRVMRSEPDEHKSYVTALNYTNVKNFLDDNRDFDFEKDLFYFSFPGSQGRFIFEGDIRANTTHSTVHTLPSTDFKIQFVKSGDLSSYFIITDTYGNKYYFGQSTSSREKTIMNYKDNRDITTYDPENEREFISSWYLDRIVYANQPSTKDITLTYISSSIAEEQVDQSVPFLGDYYDCIIACISDNDCNNCDQFSDSNNINTFKSEIGVKYLSTINFPKGSVHFSYSNSRTDLVNGKRLTTISLRDHNGNTVSTTNLIQSYFNASNSYYKGGTYGSCISPKCYRLKLDAIERDGSSTYSFDYTNGNDLHPNGSDMYELPPRDSYYIDHWGYYNGGPHQGSLYTFHPSATFLPNFNSMRGIDKAPTIYSKANLLNRITYPTGGYRLFTFGKHPSDLDFWGNDSAHGGVRVESIKDYDENDNLVTHTSYQYFDPNSAPDPGYKFSVPQGGIGIFGKSKTHIFDLQGPLDGYEEVHETNVLTGAKTKHYFISLNDKTPNQSIKQSWILNVVSNTLSLESPQPTFFYAPYVINSLDFYDLGMEDKVVSFDELGNKIMERENHYSHEVGSDYSIFNRSFYFHSSTTQSVKYTVSLYNIRSANIFLDHTITRSYESGDLVSEITTYNTYDDTYQTLPVEIRTERTDATGGESFDSKQELYYAFDWPLPAGQLVPSNGALTTMINKHMIGIPVSRVNQIKNPGYADYQTAGVSLTTFQKPYGLIHPHRVYQLSTLAPGSWSYLDMDYVSTSTYNSDGLLSSVVGRDEIATNYTYDPQGYLITKSIDPGVASLQQTTSYTYEPLVGIKTMTDPIGNTITYEYDSRNRLHLTRDEDNNIIQRYRYNYGNENNELTGTIEINGSNLPGTTQNIRVVGLTGYGPTEIKWYDSNGNLLSTSASFNHSFSGTGSKSVKLVLVNPEYEPVTLSKSKTFYNEWSLGTISGDGTICSDGDVLEPVGGGSQTLTPEFYSIQVNSGGTSCGVYSGNYSFQWQHNRYGGWVNFGGNTPIVELPATLRNIGSFQIKVIVTSNCGSKESSQKTIDVEFCPNGGGNGGGTGGGTGSGSWSVSMSPTYDEICPSGSPSSATYVASINGTFSCTGLNYTYSWSIKQGSGSYQPLLGSSQQMILTRSMLQSINSSVVGSYTLRVQVTDNCNTNSATKTSTATVMVPLDCSSGIE